MAQEIKVKDTSYVKNERTGVVTNTDANALTEYKMKIKKSQELKDLKEQVNRLEREIELCRDELRSQHDEIRQLQRKW